MIIHPPLCITSRLLPGCKIGDAEISIEYAYIKDNRQRYRYFIDSNKNFHSHDLKSGVGGGTLQEGLESLLSFLGAFAEAIEYQKATGRESENAQLFPLEIADWAIENADEITMLQLELHEQQLIEE